MPAELIEALTSLDLIIDEESERLARPGYDPLLAELVAAKLRAAGQLELLWMRLFADGHDAEMMSTDQRAELTARMATTLQRLKANATLLERRIALCDDLMGAISNEARRLTGARSATYGARGAIVSTSRAAPISLNSEL